MAVKTLRRIGKPVGESLYDRMSARVLHNVTWRPSMERVEREYPDLIIERDGNLLSVDPAHGNTLLYGFHNERAFVEHFDAMFDALLPRLRKQLGDGAVRFRLSYSTARPVVEPILKRHWFSPRRDWMLFELARTVKLPPATVRGVKFRPGALADLDDVVRIDDEAFPRTPIALDAMRERISSRAETLLIAEGGKAEGIVGFALYSLPEPGEGYINIIAVAEAHRRRGIGAALTVRAAKALFAAGVDRVSLTTDQDNGPAIRLYVGLGFRQTRAGRDYARPTDPRALELIKTESRGKFIKFGGWR